MPEQLKYWVWLNSLPKIGARRGAQLIKYFGEPERIWQLDEYELVKAPFMTPVILNQLLDRNLRQEADRIMEDIHKNQISVITIKDDAYPFYLKNIHDPPVILYVKGSLTNNSKCIAIVGSRYATSYGLSMAEKLAKSLAEHKITVVSGMARGIDSYAHDGALKGNGTTVAVLGCGLDNPYPPENKKLMERIMENGAVISEYPPGMPPLPMNFPARNRIISGMCMGVVVIEAGERSGSLITVDFALEQGRDVFAVPGNINSYNSKGTNKLIKEGAKIVTCVEDILEEISPDWQAAQDNPKEERPGTRMEYELLDFEEKLIWNCLETEPLHVDILAKKSGLSMQTINSLLIMMELKGLVEQLPGKIYKLKD